MPSSTPNSSASNVACLTEGNGEGGSTASSTASSSTVPLLNRNTPSASPPTVDVGVSTASAVNHLVVPNSSGILMGAGGDATHQQHQQGQEPKTQGLATHV